MGDANRGAGARRRLWPPLLLLTAILLILLALRPLSVISQAPSFSSSAASRGGCRLLPQPTGEQYTPVVPGVRPPPVAGAGAEIRFSFAGGYLITNQAHVCGEKIIGYIYADQLPNFTDLRRIMILFAGELIDQLECNYHCSVRTTIPADMPPGAYHLEVVGPAAGEALRFQLQVVGTPTP